MRKFVLSTPLIMLLALVVVASSIYADTGKESWLWFQRSGAIVVLAGAVLGYRSIVRLGKSGVGGAPVTSARATTVSIDDSGPTQMLKVAYDSETEERFTQHALDQFAGYVGAFFMVIGTIVWGYGDLVGLVL